MTTGESDAVGGGAATPRSLGVVIVVLGLSAGFLSGLFGVGGGVIIVPALVVFAKMTQRRAAATSLVSIIITASVGASAYGLRGEVSPPATAFVVVGALVGTQIGVYLLRRLPERILPWTFTAFVVIVIVSQPFAEPTRDAVVVLTPVTIADLIGVGLLSGVFSGLVGVGGGSVIVPGLELVVGMGDLASRGTSLLAMIPTALSGTYTNLKHGLADVRTGLLIGVLAAIAAPAGTFVAAWVSARTGAILFNIFLVLILINTVMRARKRAGDGAGK